jgi:hypothetical protein
VPEKWYYALIFSLYGRFFSDSRKSLFFSGVGNMQTSNAAKFKDGSFQPIVEQCEGCERIVEVDGVKYCDTYMIPEAKWRLGICNLATHVKPEVKVVKIRVNPLKAAKRASRRK